MCGWSRARCWPRAWGCTVLPPRHCRIACDQVAAHAARRSAGATARWMDAIRDLAIREKRKDPEESDLDNTSLIFHSHTSKTRSTRLTARASAISPAGACVRPSGLFTFRALRLRSEIKSISPSLARWIPTRVRRSSAPSSTLACTPPCRRPCCRSCRPWRLAAPPAFSASGC